MLNPFPVLLDFQLLAPFLIRVVAGFIFINLGYLMLTREKERWLALFNSFLKFGNYVLIKTAAIQIIGGTMLVLGLYTQIAALGLSIVTFMNYYIELRDDSLIKRNSVFYLMLFTMVVSLLLTGAGFMAFDLPL